MIHKKAIIALLIGRTSTPSAPEKNEDLHTIDLSLAIRKRGVERRLVIAGQGGATQHPDQPLIDAVVRAHLYLDAHTKGQSRNDIAKRFNVHPEDVSRVLPLAFLSPEIVNAILTGRQPPDLAVRDLTRRIDLPMTWKAQHELLGI